MASNAQLRSQIPGWGADLDFRDRPASQREANRENVLSVREDDYEKIPRQVPKVEILLSSEHRKLTPVFGTTCPPKGLSGAFRRIAFQFSEGKKAHWLILLFADRVDVVESALSNLLRGRSHNPLREMGWRAELREGGFRSRFGHHRADMRRWGQQSAMLATIIGAWFILRNSGNKAG